MQISAKRFAGTCVRYYFCTDSPTVLHFTVLVEWAHIKTHGVDRDNAAATAIADDPDAAYLVVVAATAAGAHLPAAFDGLLHYLIIGPKWILISRS